MVKLQSLLEATPIASERTTWIQADIPRQGIGTNDCGIFASCFSFLCVQQLAKDGYLGGAPPARSAVERVTLSLPKDMDVYEFGKHGRNFMLTSLRNNKIDFKSPVLQAKVKWHT